MSGQNQPDPEETGPAPRQRVYYTVDEVAEMLGVSARWLFDRCRAEEVDHVYMARKRKFTAAQVQNALAQYTVKGPDRTAQQRELERIARSAKAAQVRTSRRSQRPSGSRSSK